eukprot:COSAG02_NODE_1185_length_14007_cov_52.908398_9_plen_110_part_00
MELTSRFPEPVPETVKPSSTKPPPVLRGFAQSVYTNVRAGTNKLGGKLWRTCRRIQYGANGISVPFGARVGCLKASSAEREFVGVSVAVTQVRHLHKFPTREQRTSSHR